MEFLKDQELAALMRDHIADAYRDAEQADLAQGFTRHSHLQWRLWHVVLDVAIWLGITLSWHSPQQP